MEASDSHLKIQTPDSIEAWHWRGRRFVEMTREELLEHLPQLIESAIDMGRREVQSEWDLPAMPRKRYEEAWSAWKKKPNTSA